MFQRTPGLRALRKVVREVIVKETLLVVVVLGDIALMLYLSRFQRSDKVRIRRVPDERRFRLPPLTWMELFDRDNYTPEGQKIVPWLYIAALVTMGVVAWLVFS
jgi:hypothetical protein